MADDAGGGLSVPSTDNWNEWTFEQALKALTGEGADLHTPAKASWFIFDPNPSASDNITYHAFDKYWYGVNIDQQAVTTWTKAIDVIDEMMADVSQGRRGSMNQQSLLDFATAITRFANFNHDTGDTLNSWATRLDSDDSSFRGKAAFLIQWRLKVGGDGLTDTYEQVTTRHGKNIATVVNDAALELGNFNKTMSDAWHLAMTNMRNWINGLLTNAINDVAGYIDKSGLQQGTATYKLDAFAGDATTGGAWVKKMLSAYPKGDLTTAVGWQSISNGITKDLTDFLDLFLDQPARSAITKLAPKYTLATSSLIEISAPPTETPPQPDPDTDGNGDGDTPPPDGGGSGDIPPPPDGGGSGDVPPPPDGGGSGDVPPPPDGGGSGDIPLPADGGGTGEIPPPPDGGIGAGGPGDGGIGDIGLGDGGLNGPPGTGGDPPADGGIGPFVPGLVPPGGGSRMGDDRAGDGTGIGPGGDGAFDEAGGETGLLRPPGDGADGPNSLLPPGAGDSRTTLPPGSGLNEIGHSGFGTDPGGGSGAGLGGGAGGFGPGTGSGGLNGLNGLPMQLSGGFPGANGAPGTSGGGGGVPFFPPMMGGAGQGGAGEKPQERERQTWLSEDAEIWGTRVTVGSGVVGRLDDEEFELEEVPLVGPSRRVRRSETPRRPRPAEEAEREATTAGEEASGSA